MTDHSLVGVADLLTDDELDAEIAHAILEKKFAAVVLFELEQVRRRELERLGSA